MTNKGACPVCGKPRSAAAAPFCSRRCADIDLHRWLQGSYAIPTAEGVDEGDDAERDEDAPGGRSNPASR